MRNISVIFATIEHMKNIWQNLKRLFFIQAPMENVTDTVFRQIIASCGQPDLFFTEFTNTDGLCSTGRKKVMDRLLFTETERPIIAQIWGNKPENYYKSAQLLKKLRFDGIDINMGCPDKAIVKEGCCSALIKNPSLAKEIYQATVEGSSGLPVSIKTRLGYNNWQTESWIGFLLRLFPAAIIVHGRIATEMSKFPANWEEIGKAVQLRNEIKSQTLIIGNGDIFSRETAQEKIRNYGLDGVMIGRGMFHDPWIFNETIDKSKITLRDKLTLLIRHVELFEKTWGNTKDFNILKRFFKIYISDFPNASNIRITFMECKNYEETISLANSLLQSR